MEVSIMKRKLLFLALLAGLLLNAGSVLAEGDFYMVAVGNRGVGTKITSLPYTLTAPGFY
jgi:hypothetical protein